MNERDFHELKDKACSGDIEAQFKLGECYKTGNGVEMDEEEADKWYHEAARQGHIEAQYMFGLSCSLNENEDAAIEWLRKAAEKGHVGAQFSLSQTILGIDGDIEEAVKWLRKAAEQGDDRARLCLEHDVRVRDYK